MFLSPDTVGGEVNAIIILIQLPFNSGHVEQLNFKLPKNEEIATQIYSTGNLVGRVVFNAAAHAL